MVTLFLIAAALGAAPPAADGGPIPASAGAVQPNAPRPVAVPDAAVDPVADRQSSLILGDDALKASRGGDTRVISSQTIAAIVSGNVIAGDYTAGSVTLSDNALSSFTGIGNLLINTGAQNSLQTGMSVVINLNQ